MRLENQFEVAVPLDRVWEALLDIEQVAGLLPGAVIEPADENDVYRGTMRVKLGPVAVNYEGTVRLGAVDERERSVRIDLDARDAQGQGRVSGVMHNRLVPTEGGTRVVVETDLDVAGRQAQFGRGIMEDVAGRMLRQFAARFEQHLLEPSPQPRAGGGVEPEPSLDVISALTGMRAARVGVAATVLLIGIAWRWRRRRRVIIKISHSW
jgi:carbon monoxide dehydrogenase subunit G